MSATAVIICGSQEEDLYFHRALAAGFDITGTFQAQQSPNGGPAPTLWVTLRKELRYPMAHAGVCDTRRGDRPLDEWFTDVAAPVSNTDSEPS